MTAICRYIFLTLRHDDVDDVWQEWPPRNPELLSNFTETINQTNIELFHQSLGNFQEAYSRNWTTFIKPSLSRNFSQRSSAACWLRNFWSVLVRKLIRFFSYSGLNEGMRQLIDNCCCCDSNHAIRDSPSISSWQQQLSNHSFVETIPDTTSSDLPRFQFNF